MVKGVKIQNRIRTVERIKTPKEIEYTQLLRFIKRQDYDDTDDISLFTKRSHRYATKYRFPNKDKVLEFEQDITLEEYQILDQLFDKAKSVIKTRVYFTYQQNPEYVYSVDFYDFNEGNYEVVAIEIEFNNEEQQQKYTPPSWIVNNLIK